MLRSRKHWQSWFPSTDSEDPDPRGSLFPGLIHFCCYNKAPAATDCTMRVVSPQHIQWGQSPMPSFWWQSHAEWRGCRASGEGWPQTPESPQPLDLSLTTPSHVNPSTDGVVFMLWNKPDGERCKQASCRTQPGKKHGLLGTLAKWDGGPAHCVAGCDVSPVVCKSSST